MLAIGERVLSARLSVYYTNISLSLSLDTQTTTLEEIIYNEAND